MPLTLELLRILQPQSASDRTGSTKNLDRKRLYEYSVLNRLSLPCLEALDMRGMLGELGVAYEKRRTEFSRMIEAIGKVGEVLRRANVDYAFHKTVRPYRSTTVDIDTLVFDGKETYQSAIETMLRSGYKLVERGPRSTTIWDEECDIGIDLYDEIAVSYIIYLDKETLTEHIIDLKLPDNRYIKHLDPEADTAALMAHSVIKEQMYALSEFYSFIHYLKRMDVNCLLRILEENNITSAARTHATITASIYEVAYGRVPDRLQKIIDRLGQASIEARRLNENDFKAPHKYHLITVFDSLCEIARGKKTRDSMAHQLLLMSNPHFTRKFLKALVGHVMRTTY